MGHRGYSKLKRADLLALLDTEPAAAAPAPAVVEAPTWPDPYIQKDFIICYGCKTEVIRDSWEHEHMKTIDSKFPVHFCIDCCTIECECCEASVIHPQFSDESDNWRRDADGFPGEEEEWWYCPDCQ